MNILKPLNQITPMMLRYCFRPLCALCNSPCEKTLALCEACIADLPLIDCACTCCGLPLKNSATCCGDCLLNPKPYQSTHSALRYQKPINHLIYQFKQQAHWQLGQVLCDLWLQQHQADVKTTLNKPCVIVPISSHPKRSALRGYCPAYIIAEHWSRALDITMAQLLINQRQTPEQKNLNRAQRLRNLNDVFVCKKNDCGPNTQIILVDDVVTTCATAISASQALQKAGFLNIQIWALARTPFEL